jgi:predicted DsbA family dithiol-disulfide isomerase
VSLAQRFAIENPHIHADCIEVTEFPEVAEKYRVYAVPKTVINEQTSVEGALPESHFLEAVLKALPSEPDPAPAGETS